MVCCSEELCGARLALREGLVCYSGFLLLCGAGRSGSGNLPGLLFQFFAAPGSREDRQRKPARVTALGGPNWQFRGASAGPRSYSGRPSPRIA